MKLELKKVELFALRSLVLDRLRDTNEDETREWHDVMSSETVTIEELLALLMPR